jgi:hypothetical protein
MCLTSKKSNPKSSFVGDLTTARHLPADSFDCIIMTQMLQYVYDLYGLSLLFIAFAGREACCLPLCQAFPGMAFLLINGAMAVARLFNERFPASAIEIEPQGSVRGASSLLQGLASDELERAKLDYKDPSSSWSLRSAWSSRPNNGGGRLGRILALSNSFLSGNEPQSCHRSGLAPRLLNGPRKMQLSDESRVKWRRFGVRSWQNA